MEIPNIYCFYHGFSACGEWNDSNQTYDVHVPALKDMGFSVASSEEFLAKLEKEVSEYLARSQGKQSEFIALINQDEQGFEAIAPDLDDLIVFGRSLPELRHALQVSAQGFVNSEKGTMKPSSLSFLMKSIEVDNQKTWLPVVVQIEQ